MSVTTFRAIKAFGQWGLMVAILLIGSAALAATADQLAGAFPLTPRAISETVETLEKSKSIVSLSLWIAVGSLGMNVWLVKTIMGMWQRMITAMESRPCLMKTGKSPQLYHGEDPQ